MNIFFTNPDGLKIDIMNLDIQDMAARFTFVVESPISSSVIMLFRTRSSSMSPSPYYCPRIVQEIGSGSYIGKLLQDVRGSSLTINASVDIVMRSKRCRGFELRVPRLESPYNIGITENDRPIRTNTSPFLDLGLHRKGWSRA